MTRTIEKMTRAAILAVAFVLCLSHAWAATPVAAWTDFRNLTSGGYTWTVGGDSSVDTNTGVLTIGSTGGVYMDISGIGSDNRSFSIAIEAEIPGTYTSDKTLVDLIVNGSHVSVAANGTTIGQCWTTGALSGTAYGKSTFTAGRQLLTVTFQGASGQGTHSYIDGTQVAGHTGLMSSSGSVTHIGIGSYNKTAEVAEGLKIYSVRLYNSKISASDVSTDYDTYGVADYVATVSGDTTLDGLTWTAKDGTTTTEPTSYTKLDIRGSGKVTSSSAFNAKMNIGKGVVFKPASVGTSSAFTGGGSIVYNGALPGNEKTCYTDSMFWNGTVWIENKTGITKFDPGTFGNANSTVKVSGIAGYFTDSNNTFNGTLEVSGTDSSGAAVDYGLSISDGYSSSSYTINKLTGDGLISDALNNKTATHLFIFNDASAFRGSISLTKGRRIQIGSGTSASDAKQVAVGSSSSVTIASDKKWQADGGIIVNGTLTLSDSSSTLTGTITGSGTIVSGGTVNVPNIASLTQSGWTGTVEVSGAASMQEMIGSSSTRFMNSGSTLKVTSGYAALTSVAGLTGKVSVNSGAALYVIDDTSTELAFALGTVEGQVNISGCSALTTLTLNVGADWAITTSKLQLPSSGTLATVNVVVGEEHGNGGSITLTNTTGLPAVDGRTYNYLVKREDGVTVSAKLEDGVLTYTPAISGAATMYDATFLNTTDFAYKKSSDANIGLDTALNPKYNNELNDATTGIYIRHHPYVNGAASDIHGLTDFTLVVVGQMSPTHKTQFIHIGSTTSSNKGLLIATTENDDEVIIAPNTGKTVDTSNAVTVSVPNAASARHAYVIIKSGSVFTVWVDGIKRGNFTVAAGWEIGASDHAGVQVGSDFGGEIQRSSDTDKYSAVANSLDETGVVNVIRIFDYVVSDAQAEAIVAAYPYISEGGLYTRTISADANLSVANAWAKDGSDTTYALPEGATVEEVYYAPSATVTVAADATLTVNADVTIDTLTVGGVGDLAVASDGTHAVTVSGAAVVNSPLSITYGAVNLAGTPVQLGSGGTLHFDCSGIDLSEVYSTTRYQLTGLIDRNDAKVTATLPTAAVRTSTLEYNTNGYYEIVVTPDHEAGSAVYYKSGYFGKGGDQAFSVVLADGTTPTLVFPGDTVVIDSKSSQDPIYVGELPDNVAAISIARTTKLASGNKDNVMLDGATVTVAEGCALTIYRDWNEIKLGDVVFNGSGVTLDQSTSGNVSSGQSKVLTVERSVSGTAPVTIVGEVSVSNGGSIANTISGSGTITYAAFPSTVPAGFTSWTGKIALPSLAVDGLNLNAFGVEGSKVELAGITGGYLAITGATIAPKIVLNGNVSIPAMSATSYAFKKISGSGNLSLASDNEQPTSFTIENLDKYSGTITSTLETPVTILAYTSPFVPAASVTKDDVTKYYISVADAMKAAGTDAATITLLGDSSANITLALGQTLDVGSTTYTGTVSVTGTNVERASSGTTYVAVDNSSNAWKSGVTSGNWTEAANWEKGVVPNTYTAVTFPSGTCAVTISGEISLKSLTTGGATFTGGTFNCQAADSISGTMRGSVTVAYPEGVLPTGAEWTDSDWEGTLVLTNCGNLNVPAQGRTPFETYGSANSKIKAPGFVGYAALQNASDNVCEAELVIDANTAVEFNHGFKEDYDFETLVAAGADAGYFFKKLSGAGTLVLDGDIDKIQYVFKNARTFTGSVTITDPTPEDFEGGKKSFVFGDSDNLDWEINDTKYPAFLVVAGDLTVAAGKTWDVPAGIVVVAGKALTLENGSSVSLISKDSEGTVAVAAGATASINDVEDGVITGNIAIPATGMLNISDTAVETLTLSCQNSGALNLSGCTKLKTLYLDFSNNPTFDFNGLTLPNTCTTIYLDVGTKRDLTGYTLPAVAGRTVAYYAQETAAEYGGSTVTFTNVDGSIGGITLRRFSGTIVSADAAGDNSQRVYAGGAQFAGAACWHEWDFEGDNGLGDTGRFSVNSEDAGKLITLTATDPEYTQVAITSRPNEPKKAVSTSSQPYADVAFGDTWSAAVRCSMPTGSDTVAVSFGDTSTGVLGLANVGGGVVQLFSWKPSDTARTILAQLKVEQPSVDNNMHIYVFVVTTESNKKYVAFYRDGEFIHKSELNFTSSFTTFKVGAIAGDTVECLPDSATDGQTDYVRLYDEAISADTAAAISARRPFVSAKETYLREVGVGSVPEWSASGEWTLKQAGGTADCPVAGQNVTVTSPGGVGGSLDVNLSADAKYDTLIFSGSGDIVVSRGENAGKIGADMLVVRTGIDLTVAYDAVNFSDTSVGVDDGATLRFNLSNYPFESVTTTTDVQLTGVVVAKEYDSTVVNRISVVGAPDTGFFTVEPKWGTDNCFYATITRNYKTFTVDVPANTVVTVDGVSYEAATPISKKYGDEVTITYTADGAFVASGTQEKIVAVGSGTGATIAAPNDYTTTAAVAYDGTTYYTTFESAMTGAPADATVTLLADVTLTEHVYRTAPVVIDGANHSISFSKTDLDVSAPHDYNNYPFYIEPASQSGVVTVSNLTINAVGGRYAFIVDYADTTLENVTINANGCTGFCKEFGGSTVLKDVNIYNSGSNSDTFRNTAIGLAAGASVDVVSGTYTSENGWSLYIFTSGGTLNVYDGTFSGDVTSSVEGNHSYRTDANLNIYGGTFENCVLNVSQSGNYHVASMAVSGGSFNAPVPLAYCAAGKIPATISDGVYGVQDGWVITFDVEGVQTQVPTAAGATPAYDGTPAKAEDDEYTYTFAGWTPTIVEATEATTYTATFTPVAKFVTFTVVVPENSVATVTGATVVDGNTYRAAVGAEVTITYAADGAFVASGTKTQKVTPTAGEVVGAPASYEITPAVAQVGTGYYATLAEAIAAVAEDGTITMLADHNVGAERIQVSEKNFTVALNGTTLSSDEADAIIFRVSNGKTIAIDGTVEGSTLVGSMMIAGGTEGHIVANGGTYENDLYCPFYANGNCSAASTIVITGATIVANDTDPEDSDAETGDGLYIAGPAAVTLTDTIITAVKTGVEIRAGSLTVEADAVIESTATAFSAIPNGNGGTVIGASIAVSPHNTNKAIALAVNGGTFTGVKAVYENYLETAARTATTTMAVTGGTFNGAVESQNVTGFISGGTFDADVPLAYCANGKVPVEGAEGGYTVVPGWVVTFVNCDDSVLEVQRVLAGATPVYTGATPTKEATTQNSYEFNGWAPEIAPATATATYKATYTEIASLVTITVPEVAGAIATVTVSEGDIISSGNTYTVKPGVTVTVTWASNGAFVITNSSTSFTAESDVTVGTSAGTLPTVTPAVAQVGGEYKNSLVEALAVAENGDTVTLLANTTLSEEYDIADGRSITLDMNGKNITLANGNIGLFHGALNLTGTGTIGGTSKGYKSIYLKGSTDPEAENYSVLTIGSGVTVASANGYGVMISANGNAGFGAKIVVNGTINAVYGGPYVNGNINQATGNVPEIVVNDGASITATDQTEGCGIYGAGYAKWTLKGGTITGVTGVEIRAGELDISANSTVVVTATGTFDEEADGSGSTVAGAAIALSQHTTNLAIDADIKGGMFSATGTNGKSLYVTDTVNADPTGVEVSISGGLFNAPIEVAESASDVANFVSGGTFNTPVAETYCASGYIPVYDEVTGTYGVKEGSYLAQVGETTYETLDEAVAAAIASGDDIYLLADCNNAPNNAFSGLTVNESTTFMVHGNGYYGAGFVTKAEITGAWVITWTTSGAGKNIVYTYMINPATVSVERANGDVIYPTALYQALNGAASVRAGTGDTVHILTDIELDAAKATISVKDTNVTIDLGGHTITGVKENFIQVKNGQTLTIKNGTIDGDGSIKVGAGASLALDGATVKAELNALAGAAITFANDASVTGNIAVPADYKVVTDETTGAKTIVALEYVAQIVGGAKYETLAEAIAAAESGDTVVMLQDATENVTVAKGQDITLDLNGKTLSGGTVANQAAITNKGTLTIVDSSDPSTGKVKREDTAPAGSYYVIKNDGTLTIEAGTYTNTSGDQTIHKGASVICTTSGAITTIAGGTLTQDYFNVLKDDGDCTINITGGTITCSGAEYAILTYGNLKVSGGAINGTVDIRGYKDATDDVTGSATITGGTFNGKFYVEQYTGYASTGTPKLAISGGTFTNEAFYVGTGRSSSTFVADATAGKIAISGGLFSKQVPADCCAVSCTPTTTPVDNWYTVTIAGAYEVEEVAMTKDTQAEAQAAASAATTENIQLPAEVAAELTTEAEVTAYKDAFEYKVVESTTETGKYDVVVTLKDTVQAVSTEAAMEEEKTEIVVKTIPGLYYSVETSDTADFEESTTEVQPAMATTTTQTIDLASIEPDAGKTTKYFKVTTSATDGGSKVESKTFGVMKTATPATKLAIIAVPWQDAAAATDTKKVTVSSMIKTEDLAEGTKIHVAKEGGYNTWKLQGGKWVDLSTAVATEQEQEVPATAGVPASSIEVDQGGAFWVEQPDANNLQPIVMIGQVGDQPTTKQVKSGSNLCASPKGTEFNLNTITTAGANDTVVVPVNSGEAPKIYRRKNNAWRRQAFDEDGKAYWVEEEPTIPAGTGFWYNKAGGSTTINW